MDRDYFCAKSLSFTQISMFWALSLSKHPYFDKIDWVYNEIIVLNEVLLARMWNLLHFNPN